MKQILIWRNHFDNPKIIFKEEADNIKIGRPFFVIFIRILLELSENLRKKILKKKKNVFVDEYCKWNKAFGKRRKSRKNASVQKSVLETFLQIGS